MKKLLVIFSRSAQYFYHENGLQKLKSNRKLKGDWKEITFKTAKEMKAYCKGLDDGGGWDCPSYEEIKKIKP